MSEEKIPESESETETVKGLTGFQALVLLFAVLQGVAFAKGMIHQYSDWNYIRRECDPEVTTITLADLAVPFFWAGCATAYVLQVPVHKPERRERSSRYY